MKRRWVFLLCCSLLVCGARVSAAAVWEGVVTRVIDGDSLRIRQGNQVVTVRLYGIDSPEHGQPYWRKARNAASDLVIGKTVRVETVTTDQYGRTVALVDFRGQLLNAEMVGRGLAWVYRHYCTSQPLCGRLDALEELARSGRRGLWQDQRPTPPWIWRHGK